jgi:hypothetical protein
MQVALITYAMEQNEPSIPSLTTLNCDLTREGIEKAMSDWVTSEDDEDCEPTEISKFVWDSEWADLECRFEEDGPWGDFVFLGFSYKDKVKLGLITYTVKKNIDGTVDIFDPCGKLVCGAETDDDGQITPSIAATAGIPESLVSYRIFGSPN